jgi:hypothetical protein
MSCLSNHSRSEASYELVVADIVECVVSAVLLHGQEAMPVV